MIIDDGSHVPAHQLLGFKLLFPLIKPGGLYVIEDIESSYFDAEQVRIYGYSLPGAGIGRKPPGNAVEAFKLLADVVNRHHFFYSKFQHVF